MRLWGPKNGNPGPVLSLLWTAKGAAEGWAGFSTVKFELLWVGMAQYLAGGANIAARAALQPIMREMLATTFCIAAIALLSLLILWRDRASPQTGALATIFGVTFAVGEVMNLYSQPQDPQVQINVMVWLTIGWALILAVVAPWRPLPLLGGALALAPCFPTMLPSSRRCGAPMRPGGRPCCESSAMSIRPAPHSCCTDSSRISPNGSTPRAVTGPTSTS